MYTVGDKIIYGENGVCTVEKIAPLEMSGASEKLYYYLTPYTGSGTYFAPVDSGAYMRPVMSRAEAEAALGEAIGKNMQQIVPDFLVDTYDDGTINVTLNNRNVPELRMSRDFTEMVEEHTKNRANQSKESREAMMFLKQKMDAAQGFIDAVKQRQNTLMTTMQAIIDLQRPFFLEGDESLLRPMILKDVAERTGLDISTISRVSNSKYVQTNYGIYPLKFFFNDGYTTEDGEEMSVREIRKILKECIDNEDKKKPLTDDELTELLKEKGYPIARRTVAKYRQQMNIPVARLRR